MEVRAGLFVLIMVTLFILLFHHVGEPPDLGSGAGALAAGMLGLSVNPKVNEAETLWRKAVVILSVATPAALALVALARVLSEGDKASASVFAAALSALGGLAFDTGAHTNPRGRRGL
ncbi:hypothetical protein ACFZDG_14160 [Kitasatospora xanthocidica]|uniref:hypothetical protein n=1 Tax=Kitasatospora xanthocidica TaxID=83382 RepID=UPI0036EB9A74